MHLKKLILFSALISLLLSFGSYAENTPSDHGNSSQFIGAVYAMTNNFSGNSVVAYGINDDGTLEKIGEFATGGDGASSTFPVQLSLKL